MIKIFKIFSLSALLFISSYIFYNYFFSSQRVSSKPFNTLLSMLLSHSVPEVSIQELKSGKDYIFLDAREKLEYDVSHIKNAIWIGYKTFDISVLKNIGKTSNIIVYCSIGYRSEKIARQLKENSYSNVKNLYGGIFEWVNQGKPVYSNHKRTTRVHGFNKLWGIWLAKGNRVYE